MKNIKKYTFNVSKYTGYRLRVEQSNLKCFRKLNYDGLAILYYSDISIDFNVDLLLIRKLKLKQLNNEIRRNSTEDYILQLIERSKEREDEDKNSGYWYSHTSGKINPYYYDDEENLIQRQENKERKKYQEKIFNQKIKQYENKDWVRK